MNREVGGLNENIGPNASHQVLLADQLAVAFKQSNQDFHVLADWDMGEVELLAVFPARKAAKPSARAFVDLFASTTVMIFPSGSQLRSEFPSGPVGMALIDPRVPRSE